MKKVVMTILILSICLNIFQYHLYKNNLIMMKSFCDIDVQIAKIQKDPKNLYVYDILEDDNKRKIEEMVKASTATSEVFTKDVESSTNIVLVNVRAYDLAELIAKVRQKLNEKRSKDIDTAILSWYKKDFNKILREELKTFTISNWTIQVPIKVAEDTAIRLIPSGYVKVATVVNENKIKDIYNIFNNLNR